jgi:hypothetical protein
MKEMNERNDRKKEMTEERNERKKEKHIARNIQNFFSRAKIRPEKNGKKKI